MGLSFLFRGGGKELCVVLQCIFGRDFLSLIERGRTRLNCCRVSWFGKTLCPPICHLRISLSTDLRKKLRLYPKFTRFNFTEFLGTSMHSESMQHIKGEENNGISIVLKL